MKRIVAGAALALLVGCAQVPDVVGPAEVVRDTTAQIASQTNVTADRLAGDWVIRQSYANQPGPAVVMALSILPNGALHWSKEAGDCVGDVCRAADGLVVLKPTGPGRWTPTDPELAGFDEEIWVMWMDFDSRTAALGTPSGEFGWIMDKNATGGSDRIIAARDIMDWFGYNLTQLREVAR